MQQFVNKNINTQYWYFLNDSFAIWRKISIKKVIFHTKQNLLLDQSTWWRHKYFTFLIAMSAFPWKIRYDNSLNFWKQESLTGENWAKCMISQIIVSPLKCFYVRKSSYECNLFYHKNLICSLNWKSYLGI